MNSIKTITDSINPASITNIGQSEKKTTSFKETLSNLLNEVNDLQLESKKTVDKFLTNEIDDVHQVMIASEKAKISLELTMAIRNQLLDAYRQIMRMQA